jgi:hypothetical protein
MRWIYLLIVLLALPLAAQSEPLPGVGVSAPEVAKVLGQAGYPADITADKAGDPLIRSSNGKVLFIVNLYQCGSELRCTSLQFTAPFRHKVVSAATIAAWNRGRRFGRAFQDFHGTAWVSMDVDTGRGMTTEALQADLNRWITVINAFETFIGRQARSADDTKAMDRTAPVRIESRERWGGVVEASTPGLNEMPQLPRWV